MDAFRMLLVSAEVLPDVFTKVVEAKRLLAVGRVRSLSEAAKIGRAHEIGRAHV